MRTIKFRAWDKTEKKMYDVVSLPLTTIDWMTRGMWIRTLDGEELIETKNEKNFELLQSTNLTDKNGKEIYESDRVKDIDGSIFLIEWSEDHLSFQAIPEVKTIHFVTMGVEHLKPCEVIGNKYES